MRGNYGRFNITVEDIFNSGVCCDRYKIEIQAIEEFTCFDSIYLRCRYRFYTFRCYANSMKPSRICGGVEKHIERIDRLYMSKFEKCKEGVKVICQAMGKKVVYSGIINDGRYEFIIEKDKDVQIHLYYEEFISNKGIFESVMKKIQ